MINREQATYLRHQFHGEQRRRKSNTFLLLLLGTSIFLSACTSEERSRALDDPTVLPKTVALQVCSNCHGVNGISTSPIFPNLAAQSKLYLTEQLKSFKTHGRSDPEGYEYMWGISARLTDNQIEGLAQYFSEQRAPAGKKSSENLLIAGKAIYEKGITASNTPACASCHGPKAEGMQLFPRLAGQHADYTKKQLMVFRNTDQRPEGALMKTIAHGLKDQDIENIAIYLEAMPSS
ncbi:c-type cytochrome [Undibacterium sp. RTI2.1]|uniref:c-type cytochrome n=1 Tax=unclassified Undibacterium TaxID=2630295 RepID=UPI002AB582CD|nr:MULTISPECIES: c-type cytochrome [unclassified Undibacterium]MDY7539928.1 c-type cytochrome [Undibacterium sp. 5I1]MEB0031161.1 c-type cytochrome [Undibacterium sp. RTI2.1]MEB0116439.1 c-type cytochrome [Undibacterium sp. RTI2.2]MEB0230535.1 c-type cytochrome [Undibacterium sp. 10I3]MEB0257233.1 c-type cytochrome [Undibacterium sp. 5I1]